MNELALFAGAGGGLLATHHLLGWHCIGYVEKEEYPCRVLEARINDGLLSPAPIFRMHTRDFIRSGIVSAYRGVADVITAGFPCQPFSRAGKQLGEADERNAWPDTIAIICLVRPQWVLLENVASLIANPYFGTILGDLAEIGYDCRWDCIPACAVGANHQRDRVWVIAHDTRQRERDVAMEWEQNEETTDATGVGQKMANPSSDRRDQSPKVLRQRQPIASSSGKVIPNTNDKGHTPHLKRQPSQRLRPNIRSSSWWQAEPPVDRVVDGLAHRVDRLKALGEGQVPAVVREVWRLLT